MQIEQMPMVRVFFEKTGRAKYIAHLDTMRTITRALKRSGLPLWYTQGFNPHLYLTFALPIALGYESDRESFDIRLIDEMDDSEIAAAINQVLPPGFRVIETAAPVMKPAEIAWADYRVEMFCEQNGAGEVVEKLSQLLAQQEIIVVKRTKKGEKEVDLKPLVKLLEMQDGKEQVTMTLRLASGNTLNIAPTLFLDKLLQSCSRRPQRIKIRRIAIYNDKLEDFR